jgi:hypothetical protein
MFNPRTLVDAYSLAKIQEENILNNVKSNQAWVSNQFRSTNYGGSAEISVGFNKGSGSGENSSQIQGTP